MSVPVCLKKLPVVEITRADGLVNQNELAADLDSDYNFLTLVKT